MTESTIAPVVRQVTVHCSPEHAFEVFTTHFDEWWPRGHHLGTAELLRASIEPRAGGRWYEIDADGTECDWGGVIEWEPPHRVLLRWQLDGQFRFDPDIARASEVEVTFRPEGSSTVVTLEHRGFERSAGGDDLHRGVNGDGGWTDLLELFRARADAV